MSLTETCFYSRLYGIFCHSSKLVPPPLSFNDFGWALEELRKQLPQRENNGRKFGPSSSTSMKRKFFLSRAAAIIRGGWGPIWDERFHFLTCSLNMFTKSENDSIINNENKVLFVKSRHYLRWLWANMGLKKCSPDQKTNTEFCFTMFSKSK